MKQTLVILAAGLSTRYGGNKQLAPVGPNGEVLLDYAVFDAVRAGFTDVTFVIRRDMEHEFRNHVAERVEQRVELDFAYQELDNLPAGRSVPPGRSKPWGTAHAILAARASVDTPFVVINADDFYGASAYGLLFEFLSQPQSGRIPVFAMIGYTLAQNLSEFGGVSRGICECNENGFVEEIVEVKRIERSAGKISGVTIEGEPYPLSGRETTSMNIWGLTPAVFPLLEDQFDRFLAENAHDPDAEFLISTALNEQIANGTSRLRVLPAEEHGFGMTFEADTPNVSRQVRKLISAGDYPEDLTVWFQSSQ